MLPVSQKTINRYNKLPRTSRFFKRFSQALFCYT